MTYKINPMPAQIARQDLDLLAQVETATLGHWRHFGFLHRQIQPLIPGRASSERPSRLPFPALIPPCFTIF